MRACVKPACGQAAVATAILRYSERTLVVRDLLPERDPNFLDLCAPHVGRLTAPVGWQTLDDRLPPEPEPLPAPRRTLKTRQGSSEERMPAAASA